MTESSTQGVKTILHPVSDLEAAKKVTRPVRNREARPAALPLA